MFKPLRFGTVFAFIVKTCLATATGTAYVQWVWTRCRQQAVTIGAIDAAFAVDKKILLLFQWDFLSEFPIPFVLAIILWYVTERRCYNIFLANNKFKVHTTVGTYYSSNIERRIKTKHDITHHFGESTIDQQS
jgi:hypothetical protein